MSPLKVFVVEDEEILRITLQDDLSEAGYVVETFADPAEALQAIKKFPPDVVLTDIRLPGINGIELLSRIKSSFPEIYVIMMTAYGSVASAVDAMKNGAYDYLTKPFQIEELKLLLQRIEELKSIKKQINHLRIEKAAEYPLSAFIGKSEVVNTTLELIKTILNSDTTVLLTGETGTGKDLMANIIHYNSHRRDKPFVKVSCAILARDVFESELFGHQKGAFTGAIKEKPGRFEMADGGTIYLDDVDDIPLELQVKLLRVLQEQEFERVGSNRTIKVDVRVIASTKANLKQLVDEGKFRSDLYYRLNVFPVALPPLRARKEDIPLLVEHFSQKLAPDKQIQIEPSVLDCFMNYHWPGNVRELKNVVERLLLLSQNGKINSKYLPSEMLHPQRIQPESCLGEKPLDEIMAEMESHLIARALQMAGGVQAKAAEILGIPPSTLRSKMAKYHLS